jgi:methylglyoxal synthase
MIAFALQNRERLSRYHLIATATTGKLIHEKCGLPVQCVLSGPLGGDAQIAAMVATGQVAAVFFFVDPLAAQAHDPDIQSLLRICNVHNVPLATNAATATYIISEKML